MRAALLLVLAVACSKKATEPPRAEQTATEPTAAAAPEPPAAPESARPLAAPTPAEAAPAPTDTSATTGAAPPPPPPSGGGTVRGKGGSAVDHARASGVLGPTDRAAFAVTGTIKIKSTDKAAAKLVEAKRDALQACYDQALRFQDTLAGELVLRVTAGKLAIARSTLKHAELEACVIDALGALETKSSVTLAFARS